MHEPVIEIAQLTRTFGQKIALSNVTLTVPRGGVYGLVGGNGAGKTTLIRHILGLFRPQMGIVRVFGHDPCLDPSGVLARIGYLSEDRDMPAWMRVNELINYIRAFFPDWNQVFATELLEAFDLSAGQTVKSLSRGQQARLGLLLALAHRPELLVLDEPSSGLDPVVRRDILTAVIRTVANEGRTVLFSSHLLEEVERISDRVVMLHRGRVVLDDSIENIKQQTRALVVRFPNPADRAPVLAGCLPVGGGGREWKYLSQHSVDEARHEVVARGGEVLSESAPSLDEIFLGCSEGRT